MDSKVFDQFAHKVVLVAPLNWGIGHATRCVPIVRDLISKKAKVIIASDGLALKVLRNYFPNLESIELPSYDIRYPYQNMLLNGLILMPQVIRATNLEKRVTKRIVKDYGITHIISDNRFGCYDEKCKSVFITHQLTIAHSSSLISNVLSRGHRFLARHFDEVFVPDYADHRWSGSLSQSNKWRQPISYIGALSVHTYTQSLKEIDICVLLSGPEPARSNLHTKLIAELSVLKEYKIVVIGGTDKAINIPDYPHLSSYALVIGDDLNAIILKSRLIICRSGYSTVMDLEATRSSAIFIPTPGQTEQEYLATHLSDHNGNYDVCTESNLYNLVDKIEIRLKALGK